MVQDIANVNGVKTIVSEVKFQKITSRSLFWRNYLNRLVQPKLSNIQNDSNQLIFMRILNICFYIHHFLLQRAKKLPAADTARYEYDEVLMAAVHKEGECQSDISMKIRTTVVPMSWLLLRL